VLLYNTTDIPLILRRCHGTTNILMITAEIAPQPKLMINVPHSGILSKPSTTTFTYLFSNERAKRPLTMCIHDMSNKISNLHIC